MRDAIALTADVLTIVGVVTLIAFLLNHPVANRLGVRAGALRGERRYGWRRRQNGVRRLRQRAADPMLRLLSKLGSETRQPMRVLTPPLGGISPDIAELLAPYTRRNEELARRRREQEAREQQLMEEAGGRIDMRRWRREHRRVRCDHCGRRFGDTLLLCREDCDWSDQQPKHLPHTCNDCEDEREAASGVVEPNTSETALKSGPEPQSAPTASDPAQLERT